MLNVLCQSVSNSIINTRFPLNTDGHREEREKKLAGMMHYFGLVMAFFYILVSAVIVFTQVFGAIDNNTRYIFGTIMFVYGCFRLFRVFGARK